MVFFLFSFCVSPRAASDLIRNSFRGLKREGAFSFAGCIKFASYGIPALAKAL